MKKLDGITQSALLSRISNLRYEVTELDRKYTSKEIDKVAYETAGYQLVNEVEELESYVNSLEDEDE